EYQLESVVELAGWSDEVEKYLNFADIQIIPSLWEGFGLVAVEGMSTGLSIVASNVAGLNEILGDSAAVTLVEAISSPISFAAGIRQMIERLAADDAATVALAARSQAEKFSIEGMLDSYINHYVSVETPD